MTFDPTLLRTVSHLARELSTGFDAHLKGMGLTSSRARVLILLTRHPDGVSQAAITEFLRVEHPTAVRILDGLEALGHVQRLPAPDDRRAKLVVLTELGKPLADAVVVLVKRLDAVLMDGLDRDEVNHANQLLGSLLERVLALKASVASEGETAA